MAKTAVPLPIEEALERAVLSMLDVLDELCQGLAWGSRPTKEWAEIVSESIEEHKNTIRRATR